jgi:hypothetical protein
VRQVTADREASAFLAVATVVLIAAITAALFTLDFRIQRLQHRVDCLEHPQGASSIAVQLRPTYKVIQPAHKTGCP